MNKGPELLSAKQAAEQIGGTAWFWRSLVWRGELSFVTLGRKHFLLRDEVEAYIIGNTKKERNSVYGEREWKNKHLTTKVNQKWRK